MSRWRILAVSGGYWHKFICVCTALNHSSTDLSPCRKLVSKSNLALTSFDCGLQKVFEVGPQSFQSEFPIGQTP